MLDDVPVDIRARGPEAVEEYENSYYHGCRIVDFVKKVDFSERPPSAFPENAA